MDEPVSVLANPITLGIGNVTTALVLNVVDDRQVGPSFTIHGLVRSTTSREHGNPPSKSDLVE